MKQFYRLINRILSLGTLFLMAVLLLPTTTISEGGNITNNYDAYADSVIDNLSEYYSLGVNALGPPDGDFAIISKTDYMLGYMTLDMGEGEDIVNGSDMDFTVVARGGSYSIWVYPNLDMLPKLIGYGNGTQSFDLASVNLFNARYINIQLLYVENVEIDAIVAHNYIKGDNDTESPRILGLEDFWIWENQSSITLIWQTFDATPENYSILLNGEPVESGTWDGSYITYEFSWPNIGEVQVTLLLYDAFGNHTEDSFTIEIRSLPSTTTTIFTNNSTSTTSPIPLTFEMNYHPVLDILLAILIALVYRRLIQRRY